MWISVIYHPAISMCLSGESVKNISKDETMNVLIKDINCNSEEARKLMK